MRKLIFFALAGGLAGNLAAFLTLIYIYAVGVPPLHILPVSITIAGNTRVAFLATNIYHEATLDLITFGLLVGLNAYAIYEYLKES